MSPPRYVPLAYDPADPENSVLNLIYTLFPQWERLAGGVKFRQLTEGKTNMILKVVNDRPTKDELDKVEVVLRVYGSGTDILTDREREWKCHDLLARFNLAPPLLGRFENGLIYRFIPGRVCTREDLRKERIWRSVARKLAEWHAIIPIRELSGNSDTPYCVWDLAEKWISALPTPSPEELQRKTTLRTELVRLVDDFSDIKGLGSNPLVLGHCDLLSGNIVIEPRRHEGEPHDAETVSFIDYEYALPCPAAFDISSHFAEWAGYECDYNLLPTRATRRAFIPEYICSFREHSKIHQRNQTEEVKRTLAEDVEKLSHEVDRFRGVPGFFCAICVFIQGMNPQTNFDYTAYGNLRLAEYWSWRAAEEGKPIQSKETLLREQRWALEE